jgi:hypothetical protein
MSAARSPGDRAPVVCACRSFPFPADLLYSLAADMLYALLAADMLLTCFIDLAKLLLCARVVCSDFTAGLQLIYC